MRNDRLGLCILIWLSALLSLGIPLVGAGEAPHVVIIHGEPEYGSSRTMPILAEKLEDHFGFQVTQLKSERDEMGELPDLSTLDDADLLILFIRFRLATEDQFARLDKWFADGKPAIAFRTTSHGFREDKGWFVPYFGGHYKAHAPNHAGTSVSVNPHHAAHPVLNGVDPQFHISYGGTYNAQPLSDFVTPLLFGKTEDLPSEPVAWTAEYQPGQKLFYTSLGGEQDFKNKSFENLIMNSVLWCLGKDIPDGGALGRNIEKRKHFTLSNPLPPVRQFSNDAQIIFQADEDIEKWEHYDPSVAPLAVGLDGRADTTSGGPVFDMARWIVDQNMITAQPGFGDIVTRQSFTNGVFHVDFLIPDEPEFVTGPFRGNSGVYINGKWEIQIIDSWGNEKLDANNTCGALFGIAPPLVNACAKPGTWQKLEVAVHNLGPDSAEISAWLNGKQIHHAVPVTSPTVYGFGAGEDDEDEDGDEDGEVSPRPYGVVFNVEESRQCQLFNNFSCSIRFRTDSDGPLVAKHLAGKPLSGMDKALIIQDGKLRFILGDQEILKSAVDVDDDEWHEVQLNYADGELSLMVDGSPDNSVKVLLPPDNAEAQIYLNMSHEQLPWLGEDSDLNGQSEIVAFSVHSDNAPVIEWQSGAGSALDAVSGSEAEKLDMGENYTAFVRFRTDAGGALIAKAPAEGPWAPNGKVLFVSEGQLVFDVGWVGEMRASDVDVSDGQWHSVVLAARDGETALYLDGEKLLERGGLTHPDDESHVFKVGACSSDFPEDFIGSFQGDISNAGFLSRSMTDAEIEELDLSRPGAHPWDYLLTPDKIKNNRPDYQLVYFEYPEEDDDAFNEDEDQDPGFEEIPVEIFGGPLRLQADTSQVRFANIAVEPLSDIDHSGIMKGWNRDNLAKGERIYNAICITCHGNLEKVGSLPSSRKFWEAEFKNGNDPYRLYKTLENGFGQMPPFPFLSPQQRYDVIHYIREVLVKPTNRQEYFNLDDDYLASLPKGTSTTGRLTDAMVEYAKGPKYQRMHFGPMLNWTYQIAPNNIAYKGIAVRLDQGAGGVSKGRAWMLYDHDSMRVAAAWSGRGFIDWKGIAFDQSHGTHASIVGKKSYTNPVGPGWAHPVTGDWEDPRIRGRDGKPYGPLPRDWVQFKGQYLHNDRVVISYTVGGTGVLESPGMEESGADVIFTRSLNIGKSEKDMKMRIAPDSASVAIAGESMAASLVQEEGFHVLSIPAKHTPLNIKVLTGSIDASTLGFTAHVTSGAKDLSQYILGSPERWSEIVETEGVNGGNDDAFVVDEISLPHENPWNSWMRLGGFDFFEDGKRAAVATWLGDVWIVDGIDADFSSHRWKRICSGLFQPLGVKIVNNQIYITCRDQIARLHDLNGDSEIDYIESFNNDHQVTEHFHEFAMGLQTDSEGNFYYAKSARHAMTAVVPHHGTLLRVSPDGKRTDIIATGFRAANGVCINPDGSFIVTDQEGNWNPKNRINYVREGGFYGNMWGYHDTTDESDDAMEQPLSWITNSFDRSPGELLWVPENASWGSLNGSLLNLSYGMGRVFVVPHEVIDGQAQGGMVSLGLDFPTGIMRGRFHPVNGQLYTSGMFAWAGNRSQDGGFYRLRRTNQPAHIPIALQAYKDGIKITFSEPLNRDSASLAANYQSRIWDIRRTSAYGSDHYNTQSLPIHSVKVLDDEKSVFLSIPTIRETWCMEIKINVTGKENQPITHTIHNTIHHLSDHSPF